jgi:hypothetical protein
MIRLLITLLFLATFAAVGIPTARAQTEATRLASLAVELWPDYDRPAMLVLLTGTLPADAALPATLTIPIPPEAEINAVASFNASGALMSDVDYTIENGRITLATPGSPFRVEYYTPYQTNGNEYTYSFNWTSGLSIDQVTTVVQQPVAATDFRVTPSATGSAAERGDGLTYHTLPPRAVGADEPFTVEVAYTVDAPLLSAPSQAAPVSTAAASPAGVATTTGLGFSPWWLVAAAGVLVLVGGAWYLGRQQGRSATRARKPQPARPGRSDAAKPPAAKNSTSSKYCHNCGRPAQPGDTFCRHCGAQLKTGE